MWRWHPPWKLCWHLQATMEWADTGRNRHRGKRTRGSYSLPGCSYRMRSSSTNIIWDTTSAVWAIGRGADGK
eukprot:gene20160-biopygen2550